MLMSQKRRYFSGLQEAKPLIWRAIAVFKDGREGLVYLGRSSMSVKENYVDSWKYLYDNDDKEELVCIIIQKWFGAADCGSWKQQGKLHNP